MSVHCIVLSIASVKTPECGSVVEIHDFIKKDGNTKDKRNYNQQPATILLLVSAIEIEMVSMFAHGVSKPSFRMPWL